MSWCRNARELHGASAITKYRQWACLAAMSRAITPVLGPAASWTLSCAPYRTARQHTSGSNCAGQDRQTRCPTLAAAITRSTLTTRWRPTAPTALHHHNSPRTAAVLVRTMGAARSHCGAVQNARGARLLTQGRAVPQPQERPAGPHALVRTRARAHAGPPFVWCLRHPGLALVGVDEIV